MAYRNCETCDNSVDDLQGHSPLDCDEIAGCHDLIAELEARPSVEDVERLLVSGWRIDHYTDKKDNEPVETFCWHDQDGHGTKWLESVAEATTAALKAMDAK